MISQSSVLYENSTNSDKVIILLNAATLANSEGERILALKEAQDLILFKEPQLLEKFFNEILSFQSDPSLEVKKNILVFIEEACKRNPQNLGKAMGYINLLLRDSSPLIQKKVIQIFTPLYKVFLEWVTKPENQSKITDMTHQIWIFLKNIKQYILNLIESENDGIRTQVLKFVEALILIQSSKSADSYTAKTSTFSLDDVPERHKFLRYLQLQEESKQVFATMIKLCNSITISHSNLNTVLGSLTDIALQRPQYMGQIITALVHLYTHLPPTLAKSQVTSVKKGLKNRLVSLVKHPSSVEYQSQILQILTELGVSQNEINRSLPKSVKTMDFTKSHPRMSPLEIGAAETKMATMLDDGTTIETNLTGQLNEVLEPLKVVDFVLELLPRLPETMPANFVTAYQPILRAGSTGHRTHLAQMLAELIEEESSVKKLMVEKVSSTHSSLDLEKQKALFYNKGHDKSAFGDKLLLSEGGNTTEEFQLVASFNAKLRKSLASNGSQGFDLLKRSIKLRQFLRSNAPNFLESVPPGSSSETLRNLTRNFDAATQCKNAVFRILFGYSSFYPDKYKIELFNSVISFRDILLSIPNDENHSSSMRRRTEFSRETFEAILDSLLADIPGNLNLVILILVKVYREMASLKRYEMDTAANGHVKKSSSETMLVTSDDYKCKYEELFIKFLRQMLKDDLMDATYQFFTKVPLITERILDEIYDHMMLSQHAAPSTLLPLCIRIADSRPALRQLILNHVIFKCVTHPTDLELRKTGTECLVGLYELKNYGVLAERFALTQLRQLTATPPTTSSPPSSSSQTTTTWTDEWIKLRLALFLLLLPKNHKLVSALVEVYVVAGAEVKRVILKSIEGPVRQMGGVESEELLSVIRNCPKGCETLVTRLVYIMATDTTLSTLHNAPAASSSMIPSSSKLKTQPSNVLVNAVRTLYYQKKLVTDVRILIPIVSGLNRDEVIALLPKFLALTNVNLVKEVILKCCCSGTSSSSTALLTPSELLVALHMIPTLLTPVATTTTAAAFNEETEHVSAEESITGNMGTGNCDTKALIRAINICFANKRIFNSETVCIAIESLLEAEPLPILFMRTVVQSIVQYPHLLPFTVEVLNRLVSKQVWRQQHQAWLGFVKCCQKIAQNALPTLLRLPLDPLEDFLNLAPEFKEPLAEYLQNIQQAGRGAEVPFDIVDFIENKYVRAPVKVEIEEEELLPAPQHLEQMLPTSVEEEHLLSPDQPEQMLPPSIKIETLFSPPHQLEQMLPPSVKIENHQSPPQQHQQMLPPLLRTETELGSRTYLLETAPLSTTDDSLPPQEHMEIVDENNN